MIFQLNLEILTCENYSYYGCQNHENITSLHELGKRFLNLEIQEIQELKEN